jgi:hypothetical protein
LVSDSQHVLLKVRIFAFEKRLEVVTEVRPLAPIPDVILPAGPKTGRLLCHALLVHQDESTFEERDEDVKDDPLSLFLFGG